MAHLIVELVNPDGTVFASTSVRDWDPTDDPQRFVNKRSIQFGPFHEPGRAPKTVRVRSAIFGPLTTIAQADDVRYDYGEDYVNPGDSILISPGRLSVSIEV